MRNVAHTALLLPWGMRGMRHIQPSLLPWVVKEVRVNVDNVLPGG